MWKKKLVKLIFILVVIGVIVSYFISHFHYSEGTQTGYLSKFSKKGLVFKTYEGDLFLGGASAENSTLINNTWSFSVPDIQNQLFSDLQKFEGNVVKVYYYEVLKSFPWQGDTRYFVYKVEFVRE